MTLFEFINHIKHNSLQISIIELDGDQVDSIQDIHPLLENNMIIKPITFKQACEFVNKYHRHHSASQGCKWCIGLYKDIIKY